MRNLLVACDGTWNTPDQQHDGVPTPTNVVRFFNATADTDGHGNEQLKYYHPGVGTEGNWWNKLVGGGTGIGLSRNVMSAYRWLGGAYRRGDRIFLVGFSRGAYTVRSLAGMIASCGLLDLTELADNELWRRVGKAYTQGYRKGKDRSEWSGDWAFHGAGTPKSVRVYFVGVWDTVGALGIPNDLAILNLLDDADKYAFHDTKLNTKIQNARHAVAIDERRASFAPSLWSTGADRHSVKQVWFPGVHSDVGGGYPETGLSDGALAWMMTEAADLGLAFHQAMRRQVIPDSRGVLHDSFSGVFKHLRSQPRGLPKLVAKNRDLLHASVLDRQKNPPITQAPYRPTKTLAVGEDVELSIYAEQPWNDTGLFLEPGGRYDFVATGQWVDKKIKCGPGGTTDGKFYPGELAHVAGTLLGKVEGAFKKLTSNDEADLRGTRRVEDRPWFSLVGAIANGGAPSKEGVLTSHEIVPIGERHEHAVERPGYLYCFANDAWHFYENNSGSVTLRVKRLE